MTAPADVEEHDTDVLVLGGGPAATWAAISAAESGSRVTLVDKGYCGTSGATAAGGNNLWLVPPGPRRDEAVRYAKWPAGAHRLRLDVPRAGHLVGPDGAPRRSGATRFPVGADGRRCAAACRGRSTCVGCGVRPTAAACGSSTTIPLCELTTDPDGVVDGATGIARQDGGRPWQITAGAVVVATGGTAFLSGHLRHQRRHR